MCEPVSATMAAVGVGSSLMQSRATAKQEAEMVNQQRRQQHELVKQNNWANADAQLTASDNTFATRNDLTQTNIERMNNLTALSTALGEGMIGGNSAKRLKTVQGIQHSMADSDLVNNYHRDYQAIFAGTVGSAESVKSTIGGMAEPPKTSRFQHFMNAAESGLAGAQQGLALKDSFSKYTKKLDKSVKKSGSVRAKAGVGMSTK